jgi:hypothetical protein
VLYNILTELDMHVKVQVAVLGHGVCTIPDFFVISTFQFGQLQQ